MNTAENTKTDLESENENLKKQIELLKNEANSLRGRLYQATYMEKIGIWDWDIETDETQWYGEMFNIYGITKEEFTGKGGDYLGFTHPEDKELQANNIEKDFQKTVSLTELTGDLTRIKPDPKEFRIIKKNGTLCWVRGDAVSVVDKTGKAIRMLGILKDITDKKLLEQELLQSQKMEALGIMASGISHEFNNILMTIQGYTELSLMNLDDILFTTKNLHQIKDSISIANDIVKQILLFSKKEQLDLSVLDPFKSLEDTIKLVKLTIPNNISLISNIDPNLMPILGNENQLKQVGANLINNSIHAIGKEKNGLIKITATNITCSGCTLRRIHHDTMLESCIQIKIEDNGPGISDKIISKIYDPFFTTKSDGTGLGLSVVKGIVNNHKGNILVQSKLNEGSTFVVCLPHTKNKEQINIPFIYEMETTKTNATILLVEDQKPLLNLYDIYLSKVGFKVKKHNDGANALKDFDSNQNIDLILTDFKMPYFTGYDLAKEVRKKNSTIPIIVMSGSTTPQRNFYDLGNIAFIQKPFELKQLKIEIDKTLDKKGT